MELTFTIMGAVLLLFAIVIAKLREEDVTANTISMLLTGYLLLTRII